MKTLYSILLLLSFITVIAQQETLNNSKYRFAKEVFKNNYKVQKQKRFVGKIIIIDDNTIKYDDKVLIIPDLNEDYRNIFISGLLHPNIITGYNRAVIKTKTELEAMSDGQIMLYNLTRNDTINVGYYFDELKALNNSPKRKRFVFWRYYKDVMNPSEYYFELYNKKATKATTSSEFIRGAELTFFHFGTIII